MEWHEGVCKSDFQLQMVTRPGHPISFTGVPALRSGDPSPFWMLNPKNYHIGVRLGYLDLSVRHEGL